ncbi:MAG: hypothetical protein UX10_C0008G0027 [Candidatus Magasanikbacteria bacterium GW2011_GWA2_45_39]|uniref:Uncharacterized protein n=1 Tax=Candidatus Magasanikbacteria bacterium GW2011_GWA2_45_39 TaxID=1619041 RepID=A0A0G1MHF7_9BACT|nr:MAG: hypothetical protein UX10_C0008G0027 [Candidatus Magasanikbacteria bacterium GW2011_GWA2_45_39]
MRKRVCQKRKAPHYQKYADQRCNNADNESRFRGADEKCVVEKFKHNS